MHILTYMKQFITAKGGNNLKKKQIFNYDEYNNTYYYIEVLYDESNTKKKPMKLSDLKKRYNNKQQGVSNQWI